MFQHQCCRKWQMLRNFSRSRYLEVNHYESLGLTPKATQADIKSAYYELSKIYHPDRNEGKEDCLLRFRDITTAYEVLGNVRARRMYDKGLVVGEDETTLRDDNAKASVFNKKKNTVTQYYTGKTTVYDFDAWSKAHYSEKRELKKEDMAKYKATMARYKDEKEASETDFILLGILIFLMSYLVMHSTGLSDDKVLPSCKLTDSPESQFNNVNKPSLISNVEPPVTNGIVVVDNKR